MGMEPRGRTLDANVIVYFSMTTSVIVRKVKRMLISFTVFLFLFLFLFYFILMLMDHYFFKNVRPIFFCIGV